MKETFTDPGTVYLSGDNPYMVLFRGDGAPSSLVCFWRVHHSAAGTGCVLYLRSEVTNDQTRIYTDNLAVARFVQAEMLAYNAQPFGIFADQKVDAVDATFEHRGMPGISWYERVRSATDDVSLSWYDFLPAFFGCNAVDPEAGRQHVHYAAYFPARGLRLSVNGALAGGAPRPSKRQGRDYVSAGLAWGETWTRPLEVRE
jgi:hypothetical protein